MFGLGEGGGGCWGILVFCCICFTVFFVSSYLEAIFDNRLERSFLGVSSTSSERFTLLLLLTSCHWLEFQRYMLSSKYVEVNKGDIEVM